MDCGVLFETKGRVMSQAPVDRVDLCDNLSNTEAVTAQSRNLNEKNALAHSPSEERGAARVFQETSINNNGKEEEEDGIEGDSGKGVEEEEEMDQVMKEDDNDDEEESSSLIPCRSPDTPMTDSSYSETGSLLETPYPFSPGTSPEPTSPTIPLSSPDTMYSFSQSDVQVDSGMSVAFTTGPSGSTPQTVISDTWPSSPVELTRTAEAKMTLSTTQHTSSTERDFNHGPAPSHAGPITSTAETFPVTSLNTSISSITAANLASTTGLTSIGTNSTSIRGPTNANWKEEASTCLSVSTCSAKTLATPALLGALEHLAQRGDDSRLPHYLHQIAEAFVHQKDYQRALWCIQLERLYHQRVLDNLNSLQEQWESQCERTSSDLEAQHLVILKHICQTHSRPAAGDAECASLDFLRPAEEGASLPSCTAVSQVDRGMEQGTKVSSSQSSNLVKPCVDVTDGLDSPEVLDRSRKDPDTEVEERDNSSGPQLTDEEGSCDGRGGDAGGGAGPTIPAEANALHPPAAAVMDQSKSAEQQGGDSGLADEKEAKREEAQGDVEEVAEDLEMEDEGEEEDERRKERDPVLCQKAVPVDTLISEAVVEAQQLQQEEPPEEKLDEDTEESIEASLLQEAYLTQEALIKQIEQRLKEAEEERLELESAELMREAASLDDMAKLITVEEISPALGLVSILKRRSVHVHTVSVSSRSEVQPDKSTAKRRVRFKVPDDDEQEVGGGDSCLLLFLLCLVTVVISVGGTALYCALGDAHSSVCQDFSRNADFYFGQLQHGISHLQHWFTSGS